MTGHLHILQWLRAQDPPCPWNAQTPRRAAKRGKLDVIRWCREVAEPRCEWGPQTCQEAAYYGHLARHRFCRGLLSMVD